MSAKLTWRGDREIKARMDEYARKVVHACHQVANYWALVMEAYAKDNASWTDRTANARQTLHAFVEELSNEIVVLYLAHGMTYGVFLEVRFAGRYAIIWPTIEEHLPQITAMLQAIFS